MAARGLAALLDLYAARAVFDQRLAKVDLLADTRIFWLPMYMYAGLLAARVSAYGHQHDAVFMVRADALPIPGPAASATPPPRASLLRLRR
jgi:hypothetical protein